MVPATAGPVPQLVSAVYPTTIMTFPSFNLKVLISFCLHIFILISTTSWISLAQPSTCTRFISLTTETDRKGNKKEKDYEIRVSYCHHRSESSPETSFPFTPLNNYFLFSFFFLWSPRRDLILTPWMHWKGKSNFIHSTSCDEYQVPHSIKWICCA